MARIRTIKPEFPQSESMGRCSRDARLLFIMLWTIVDDSGRTRAASRMLASLLYPYDGDAGSLIQGWLDELVTERCIVVYIVNGHSYLEICNWLDHQKIDKPSRSKFPSFVEPSRILANPREGSSGDQRIKDQGSEDQGAEDRGRVCVRDEDDIGQPAVLADRPQLPPQDRWHLESREPWAIRLAACGCKLGAQSWPHWKSLVDEYGLDRVAKVSEHSLDALERWSSNAETAIKAQLRIERAKVRHAQERKEMALEATKEAPRRESAQEGRLRRLAGRLTPLELAGADRYHVDAAGDWVKGRVFTAEVGP